MTKIKKELIEQVALEAYPENKGYSTVIEKVVDYNYIKRKPYQDGLEKGWQMAVDKACKWLKEQKKLVFHSNKTFIYVLNKQWRNRL